MTRLALLSLIPFLLALLTFSSPTALQHALEYDGSIEINDSWGLDTDPIQLESIEVSPDPPKPGKDLTVKVKAIVSETIEVSAKYEGAYADVTVKLGLIKLLQKQFDVCDEARRANASVQCPVQPGSYAVEHTVALPKEIPKAKFMVSVRGFTANEDDMLCLDLKVDFLPKFPRMW
ncbi:hypothetical protein AMATHDRAFT_44401 [Amanita thiersii Skay4041]|uniref:Phosphatidylglycerol/phosphatidylinositol transfer protein n=1 Tax=Amanita thiersii Skay4041 TaxID=703135 RepID=A0A2A9NVH2_9AGAR|nr:hypothetical protein AMATHDRAFT_44401 [Amanita thiersii Skay4041]